MDSPCAFYRISLLNPNATLRNVFIFCFYTNKNRQNIHLNKKMEADDEMLEEHLDEEYQNNEVAREFAEFESQIQELEKKKAVSGYDKELQDKLEKTIALLRLHVQNYQRIIIFNRRRARQRLRKRQCTLRNFFLQSLMEMQIRFVEMLPLAVEPSILLDNNNMDNFESKEETSTEDNLTEKCVVNRDAEKSLNFYSDVVSKFTNDQWLHTFHMSKNIFKLICTRLKTALDNIDMDVENWIAMCIYMFASGSEFSSVALLFNVTKKSVRQALFRFSECLLNEFSEKMSMPTSKDELENISNGFYEASNMMPCVAGVLSLFKMPNVCNCGPLNNCGSEPLKVQVCIDHNLIFRKVETTSNKPTMFLRSPNEISLYSKKFTEKNLEMPYFVVAPENYPLRNWLMQKYDKPQESWEYHFNKSCGSLNVYREVTLKKLFGRWHILNLTECILPESKSFIVKACCLLHNILEENKEYFSLEWCTNFDPAKYECRLTTAITQFFNDSKPAIEQRNIIAKFMSSSDMRCK